MSTREEKICANMGLVYALAGRFTGRGIEYEDLVQAGCMGLIKATDGFDESRGLKFSTYAVPVILGEMRRLFRDGGTVKVSRSLKELSLRALREKDAFSVREGREPTVTELAARLGVSPEDTAQALGAAMPALSLTRSGEDDDGDEIDIAVEAPEAAVTDRLALQQVLGMLPEKDRRLIELRYLRRMTQQAAADRLGMTQVQVSRRERVILANMRRLLTG
ncbi:MAG: sigma-70 family RNA polymerase sigma factor [Clostridia bacterium]|nr:sigma-70 family RNA polymerase sigma factor [Clostridia bacterium]